MADISIDISFTILFALFPLIVLRLLSHAGISCRKFSIPSMFVIFYFTSVYIGIVILYFGLDSYSVSLGVIDKAIILRMFLYSSLALIMVLCGFLYARHVLGLKSNVNTNRVLVAANMQQRIFVFFTLLLCGAVLLAYVFQLEAIALFRALNKDIVGAKIARSKMGNAFEGKYWRYHLCFRYILDYCVVFLFADYLIKRRRLALSIFLGSFLLATFSAIMAIEKGPFMKLIIMLYLTYVIYKGGRFWQPAAKYVALFSISTLSLFYICFMGQADVTSALQRIPGRILTGQITPAYFYLDLFPRNGDYLWGASFPNPGGMLPFEPYPLTVEVSKVISPESFTIGVVGSSPTVFWAEMYANFGLIGVVFSSFLVGIGLFSLSHILESRSLSCPVCAAMVTLSMHYVTLTGAGLSGYVFDTTLFAIVLGTFVMLRMKSSGISSRTNLRPIVIDGASIYAE